MQLSLLAIATATVEANGHILAIGHAKGDRARKWPDLHRPTFCADSTIASISRDLHGPTRPKVALSLIIILGSKRFLTTPEPPAPPSVTGAGQLLVLRWLALLVVGSFLLTFPKRYDHSLLV